MSYYSTVSMMKEEEQKRIQIAKTIENEVESLQLEGKEREAIVKVRVNQTAFRDGLLKKYRTCCLCGISNPDLLVASHIKPWRACGPEEKLDINNGLLLCANHDKLFDGGYISFSDEGNIIISSSLSDNDRIFTNVRKEMRIQVNDKMKEYLSYHKNNEFRQ